MKTPIYFLPGTMCTEQVWHACWQWLPAHFDCQFLAIPDEPDIPSIVQTLAAQLPKQPIHLVGFSLGGYIASAYAVRYQTNVKSLTVVSNTPCALPEHEILQRQKTLDWLASNSYNGMPISKIRKLLATENHSNQAIIDLIKQMDAELGQSVLINQLSATTARQNLADSLFNAEFATQLIYGEQDSLLNISWLTDIKQRLSSQPKSSQSNQISLLPVSPSGHMLPLELPKLLANVLSHSLR